MSKSNASYFILPTSDMERSSLQTSNATRTTKKSNYGSLRQESQSQQTANKFIVNYEHTLQPSDTLLGISLKYNVPIENIKRANRLWSNDLTFSKETLIIPLDKDKMKELNLTMNGEPKSSSSSFDTSVCMDKTEDKAEYKDFLNKFDSFINQSKMQLKNLESQNSSMAIAEYLSNSEQYNNKNNNNNNDTNNNSFRDDDMFVRNDSLFRSNGNLRKKPQTESSSLSLSSASSSNLSGVLQRSSNSNLTSNGNTGSSEFKIPETSVITPSKYSNNNFYGSNHNLISSTDGSTDRAKIAKEHLQRLEREKDNLYEL